MRSGAEGRAINLVYGADAVLWYESNVDAYAPGLDSFAQTISVSFGIYNAATKTRGMRLGGGTYSLKNTPPNCPSSAAATPGATPGGAPGAAPGLIPPVASAGAEGKAPKVESDFGFESTFRVCLEELASRTFEVKNGGLEVILEGRWTDSDGNPKPECEQFPFTVVLEQKGSWWGWNEVSSTTAQVGSSQRARWTWLEPDTYRLRILRPWLANMYGDGSCCLSGDLYVGTFFAPKPKPGEEMLA